MWALNGGSLKNWWSDIGSLLTRYINSNRSTWDRWQLTWGHSGFVRFWPEILNEVKCRLIVMFYSILSSVNLSQSSRWDFNWSNYFHLSLFLSAIGFRNSAIMWWSAIDIVFNTPEVISSQGCINLQKSSIVMFFLAKSITSFTIRLINWVSNQHAAHYAVMPFTFSKYLLCAIFCLFHISFCS